VSYDKTCESLEKRDFDLLDDIAVGGFTGDNHQNKASAQDPNTGKQLNQIQSVA
jgi:hypothetical protein